MTRKGVPNGQSHTQHGTRSKYVQGCRCDECTEANATYRRSKFRTHYRIARPIKHDEYGDPTYGGMLP